MSKHIWNVAGALVAVCIAAPHMGDLEVNCVGGTEFTERWASSVNNIPWSVTYDTSSGQDYWTGHGGFGPSLNGFSAALPVQDKPGVSSLVNAAQNWNVIIPDAINAAGEPMSSAGGAATTIEFSKQPTLALRRDYSTSASSYAASPPLALFSYVPSSPIQCCYGLYRALLTTTVPDTINFESIGGTARNTVDFVGNGRYWQSILGQPTNALAVSQVRLVNNEIVEFDIGFNACRDFWQNVSTSGACTGMVCATYVPGLNYSWLSESKQLQMVLGNPGGLATYAVGGFGAPTQNVNWPQIGFGDIEGVMTHELGHALGLGHSYQDGRSNLSLGRKDPTDFPTMFPNAQATRLEESYAYSNPQFQLPGETTWASWSSATLGNPMSWPTATLAAQDNSLVRGVLGYSARSLELDDIAAIGRGYGTAAFNARTTSINGTVMRNGAAYRGALVTAFEIRNPSTIVASTLSYANGAFDLAGLPSGRYVLRVEPFPRGVLNATSVFPSYIAGSCNANTADFPAETWNTADAATELSGLGTIIPLLTAGMAATANFIVDGAPMGQWATPVMTIEGVSAVGAGGVAPSGLFVANRRHMSVGGAYNAFQLGATAINVNLRISGSANYAGAAVAIVGASESTLGFRFGQLSTVVADGVMPNTGVATLDAQGNWQGTVSLISKVGRDRINVQMEAYAIASGQSPAVINSVGAWFWY